MRQYGTLGLVWFDIAQDDGIYHQDWHIEDNPAAETAFRHARLEPDWPVYDRIAGLICAN